MSREHIERVLVEYFRERPDVCAVYLFGSQATDEARPNSDVDVGLLYRDPPPASLTAMPFGDEAALGERLGKPVQLIVMNTAPAELVHYILRAQRLLLDKDPSFRISFEVRRRNEYFDLKPVLDVYRRGAA
jgi:predicted nucleotidyltransferase